MSHRARVLIVAVTLAAVLSPLQAIPPAINIPAGLRGGDWLPVHEKMVTDRIKWWLGAIRMDNLNEDIVKHRKQLISDYRLYQDEPAYQQQFAEIVTDMAKPYVTGEVYDRNDELTEVKRINVAMAVAEMNSAAIQPLLATMLASDNAAIRFFAWNGYAGIRTPLLTGQVDKQLLDAVSSALEKESSPVVLAEVYDAVNLNPGLLVGVTDTTRKAAAATFIPLLAKTWPERLKALADAKDDKAIEAVTAGVRALETYRYDDVVAQGRLLILDAGRAAANAYDKALTAAKDDRAKALAKLLEAVERALLELTPLTKPRIADALKSDTPGAKVLLAVMNWQADLEEQNLLPASNDGE
jgi:hypothetical protein